MKIIIFTESSFGQRDFKRYGIEIFLNHGLFPEIWNFTPLLRRDAWDKIKSHTHFQNIEQKYFESIEEYRKELNYLERTSIVIVLFGLRDDTKIIIGQLHENQIRYGYCELGVIPAASMSLSRILSASWKHPVKLLSIVRRKLKKSKISFYPNFIITAGKSGRASRRYPRNENTEIIRAHSLDYDLFLAEELSNPPPIVKGKYFVFLDENVPFHPDYYYENMKPDASVSDYYPDLIQLFKYLENEYNIKVIVAVHPSSKISDAIYLDGYNSIKGQTINLVKHACCVLTHSSTAISFAVLYKKPLMFISSKKYSKRFRKIINHTAEFFNRLPVSIETYPKVEFEQMYDIDKMMYEMYKNSYIKEEKTANIPIWEIFVGRINAKNMKGMLNG